MRPQRLVVLWATWPVARIEHLVDKVEVDHGNVGLPRRLEPSRGRPAQRRLPTSNRSGDDCNKQHLAILGGNTPRSSGCAPSIDTLNVRLERLRQAGVRATCSMSAWKRYLTSESMRN